MVQIELVGGPRDGERLSLDSEDFQPELILSMFKTTTRNPHQRGRLARFVVQSVNLTNAVHQYRFCGELIREAP